MKGILLVGGKGTRLYPITKVVNKHVLPVYNKPMLFWGLETLVNSGISEIAVVSGPPFGHQVKTVLEDFNLKILKKIMFVNQPEPKGMPDGILRCEKFAENESVMVVAGDNLFTNDFRKEVNHFKKGAVSFLRKVKDPRRFGVPVYNQQGKLISIKEKPKNPKTNWVITGPHIFDNQVFGLIKTLRPSARGELEISELNNLYLKKGQLKLIKRNEYWSDVGTLESLAETAKYLFERYGKK